MANISKVCSFLILIFSLLPSSFAGWVPFASYNYEYDPDPENTICLTQAMGPNKRVKTSLTANTIWEPAYNQNRIMSAGTWYYTNDVENSYLKTSRCYWIVSGNQSGTITVELDDGLTDFSLTVNNGMGSGNYASGTVVNITPTVPAGQQFASWTVENCTLNSANTVANNSINMPANECTVTATFTYNNYTLTVNGGTGSGSYAPGTNVNIAPTVPEGQVFVSWAPVNCSTNQPATVGANTITMPYSDCSVTSSFTASGSGEGDNDADVPAINAMSSSLGGKLDSLKTSTDGIKNSVDAVKGSTDILAGKIDVSNGSLSEMADDLDSIASSVAPLGATLESIDSHTGDMYATLQDMEVALSEMQTSVESIDSHLESMDGKLDKLSDISETLTEIKDALASGTSTVDGSAVETPLIDKDKYKINEAPENEKNSVEISANTPKQMKTSQNSIVALCDRLQPNPVVPKIIIPMSTLTSSFGNEALSDWELDFETEPLKTAKNTIRYGLEILMALYCAYVSFKMFLVIFTI